MSDYPWTQGPWRIPVANVFRVVAPDAPNYNKQMGRVPRAPWAVVCDVDPDNPGAHHDALLISAAPELYEALADLVRINEEHNESMSRIIKRPMNWKDTYLDAARAALAKAGGEA